jgi:hypothetical protein
LLGSLAALLAAPKGLDAKDVNDAMNTVLEKKAQLDNLPAFDPEKGSVEAFKEYSQRK